MLARRDKIPRHAVERLYGICRISDAEIVAIYFRHLRHTGSAFPRYLSRIRLLARVLQRDHQIAEFRGQSGALRGLHGIVVEAWIVVLQRGSFARAHGVERTGERGIDFRRCGACLRLGTHAAITPCTENPRRRGGYGHGYGVKRIVLIGQLLVSG
ncbi:hypothetical protein KTE23_29175 [Burkholderia multivorans]|nr:hypothetical protein [Burkholderia multivorans]MBU9420637.1 hypothetical protein [Burkholderia multivorans]